jgi:protein MpaA
MKFRQVKPHFFWLKRVRELEPRNSWRIVPVLNPDGYIAKTRTNSAKIDLNRNFPTADWGEKAIQYWKKDNAANPRRNPGLEAGSEPEVKCALHHILDWNPEFVVSIHTPLKVLDFDGPKVKPPKNLFLPWRSLGNYPGSLGRYLWIERNIPTLTTELSDEVPPTSPLSDLQDLVGTLVGMELGQYPPSNNKVKK